jgi:hypothetical protein
VAGEWRKQMTNANMRGFVRKPECSKKIEEKIVPL